MGWRRGVVPALNPSRCREWGMGPDLDGGVWRLSAPPGARRTDCRAKRAELAPKRAEAGEGTWTEVCGGAVRRRVREEPIAERSEPSWPKRAEAGEGIRGDRPR